MENVHPTDKALKLIILSAALAAFMSSLDGTIVNIALPTISDIFDLPSSSVSWVSTIYLLVMAGSLLIVGKLTDSIGYRKIFLAGFVLFTFGSFACGFFPEITRFIRSASLIPRSSGAWRCHDDNYRSCDAYQIYAWCSARKGFVDCYSFCVYRYGSWSDSWRSLN
jgi:hypothetical protein